MPVLYVYVWCLQGGLDFKLPVSIDTIFDDSPGTIYTREGGGGGGELFGTHTKLIMTVLYDATFDSFKVRSHRERRCPTGGEN